MKQSEAPRVTVPAEVSGRWRTLLAIGAIGLAAFGGYKVGQGTHTEKTGQHEADALDASKTLAEAEEEIKQCRHEIKKVTEKCSDEAELKSSWKNEAHCRKILAQVSLDKAKRLAESLCITNAEDIADMGDSFRRGYTQLESVRSTGSSLRLFDPNHDPNGRYTDWIRLKERPKCVPSEYIEFDPEEDSELIDLKRQMKDGKYDEIIRDFDHKSACPKVTAQCQLFGSLQESLARETEYDKRKDLVCDFLVGSLEIMLDSISKDEDGHPYERRTREERMQEEKMEVYLGALAQSVGLGGDGDAEEAALRCMTSNYKSEKKTEKSK
jgi:hypothetical protein